MASLVRFRSVASLCAIAALLVLLAAAAGRSTATASTAVEKAPTDKAVFFTADGLRQDLVAHYAANHLLPTMSSFLRRGVSATDNGLLTEAPPNTGAGWYSLATGAWPGVHGSTNNTFHINGQPFANRTAAFDPNVLQDPANVAETVRFVLTQPDETVIPEVLVLPMRESSWP